MERQQTAKLTKTNSTSRNNLLPKAAPQKATPLHPVLQLQQKIGNQAVQRLLSFGGIQAKLKVSQPEDQYEKEANRVTDQLMCMPQPRHGNGTTGSGRARLLHIQRACPECEKELHRQPKEDEEEEETIQAKEISGRPAEVTSDAQAQINGLRGSGQALSESVRAFFELRFGQDFSAVRVHKDADADRLNRMLSARAFTRGTDIFLRQGEYDPGSSGGKELLAHELVQTIQQTGASPNATEQSSRIQRTIGDDHDLRSPRFSGDPVLEACFDNERLLRTGHSGDAVEKVQQALSDAGFPLPKFGVDGIFGSETEAAVKQFQAVFALDMDGIVGPNTMGRLDSFFETQNPLPICPQNLEPEVANAFAGGRALAESPKSCQTPGKGPNEEIKGCPTPRVSGVTGLHEAADNFSGRSKERYGVGEIVKLSFASFLSKDSPPDRKAVPHGGLRWSKASGPGAVTARDDRSGTGTYRADHVTGPVTLELKVVVGSCAKSTVAQINFTVVAPSDGFMQKSRGIGLTHFINTWSIGFLGEIFLEPKDVSFNKAQFAEGEAFATANGFLKKNDGDKHKPSAPGPIGSGNSTTGCKVANPDRVFNGTIPPPFGKGDFLWEIPWQWQVGSSALTQFTEAKHHATADENGKATLEKKGAGPFAVNAAAPTSITFFTGDL